MLKTGSYPGDGTNDRLILTGLIGTLRYVRVTEYGFNREPVFKSDTMPGKQTKGTFSGEANFIAFVGVNFTVDNFPQVNSVGLTYHWVAFSTSL